MSAKSPAAAAQIPRFSVLARRGRAVDASLRMLGVDVEIIPAYVNREFTPHQLDVALLSFIVRGTGHHVISGESFEETGPSLGITAYGEYHDIVTSPGGMDVINVYLDLQNHPLPDLPAPLNRVLPDLIPLHPSFGHRLNRTVRLAFDGPEPYLGILLNLERELRDRAPGYEETATGLLKLFLIYCCRHALSHGFVPSVPAHSHPAAERLEDLRRYLAIHYAEAHTLDALAQRAGLGRTYLSRAFRAYTGKPLFNYLLERRLQAAMVALRGTDEKILGVALECGFQDLSYFNRMFRRSVGLTPSAYRQRARGGQGEGRARAGAAGKQLRVSLPAHPPGAGRCSG